MAHDWLPTIANHIKRLDSHWLPRPGCASCARRGCVTRLLWLCLRGGAWSREFWWAGAWGGWGGGGGGRAVGGGGRGWGERGAFELVAAVDPWVAQAILGRVIVGGGGGGVGDERAVGFSKGALEPLQAGEFAFVVEQPLGVAEEEEAGLARWSGWVRWIWLGWGERVALGALVRAEVGWRLRDLVCFYWNLNWSGFLKIMTKLVFEFEWMTAFIVRL